MKIFLRSLFSFAIVLALVIAVQAQAAIVASNDPALDLNSFVVVGLRVANFILGIVGALTLLMFIYGGFMWILSGGSSDKVQKGKDIILGAVVGLVIVFSSYLIVSYVTNNIFQAKNSTGGKLFTGGAPESTVSATPCKNAGGSCVLGTSCSGIRMTITKSECRQNYVCCGPKEKACTQISGQVCRLDCDAGYSAGTGLCGTTTEKCCKADSQLPLCDPNILPLHNCVVGGMCDGTEHPTYPGCGIGLVCCEHPAP